MTGWRECDHFLMMPWQTSVVARKGLPSARQRSGTGLAAGEGGYDGAGEWRPPLDDHVYVRQTRERQGGPCATAQRSRRAGLFATTAFAQSFGWRATQNTLEV